MRAEASLDDLVTQHMRTDLSLLRAEQTADEALAALRLAPPGGRIIYFYVVDEEQRLVGVVPTRRLLFSPQATRIAEIMVHPVVAIPATATVLEACEFFMLHRLLAFPIVDAERRVVGLVDVELYTEELTDFERREGNDDLFQLIGVHLTETQQASSWAAFCGRFPWLLANIAGGILAAFLSGVFEPELKLVVELSLFIPVVLALAESVTIQSVSLALQVLRGRQPTLAAIVRKLRLELLTGLFLGLASGAAVAAVALVWIGKVAVAGCLLGGIVGGVTCAAVIGVAMPNVLRWLDREPQVAAGPIALAATDMATLSIYFLLARWLFSA